MHFLTYKYDDTYPRQITYEINENTISLLSFDLQMRSRRVFDLDLGLPLLLGVETKLQAFGFFYKQNNKILESYST